MAVAQLLTLLNGVIFGPIPPRAIKRLDADIGEQTTTSLIPLSWYPAQAQPCPEGQYWRESVIFSMLFSVFPPSMSSYSRILIQAPWRVPRRVSLPERSRQGRVNGAHDVDPPSPSLRRTGLAQVLVGELAGDLVDVVEGGGLNGQGEESRTRTMKAPFAGHCRLPPADCRLWLRPKAAMGCRRTLRPPASRATRSGRSPAARATRRCTRWSGTGRPRATWRQGRGRWRGSCRGAGR